MIETIAFLAKGDLRKAINLLQSISMLITNNNKITVEMCYYTAGIPSSYEIEKILNILLDINISFNKAYDSINIMIKQQGYSLSIVLKELVVHIINNENILKDMVQVLSDLADLENMVTKSTFGDVYITALVGIFKK